jgi:putative ABC transport system permease protein
MPLWRASLASLWRRELRGAKRPAVVFALSLSVGVAAVVAVAGLSRALEAGIRSESRTLLGADAALVSSRPIAPELIAAATPQASSLVKALATMAAVPASDQQPGQSTLVALKVVDERFPFYGTVQLDRAGALWDWLRDDAIVVAPELLTRLGLRVGEMLAIGTGCYRIAAVVSDEPGRVNVAFALGPRVFMSHAAFASTGLEQFGSRLEYRVLLQSSAPLREALQGVLPADRSVRLELASEAQPALRAGLDRTAQFLGLVALVSLLVGGLGVTQAARAWIESKTVSIAVMKSLGMSRSELLALFLATTLSLALIGCLVGAAAGTGVVAIVPQLLSSVLPNVAIEPIQFPAIVRGLGLGLLTTLLFTLPAILTALRVSPLRALRHDAEPLTLSPAARLAVAVTSVGLFLAMAWVQGGSWRYGLAFCAALVTSAGALLLMSRLVQKLASALSARTQRFTWRHGLRALARPSAGTRGAIVALGLGVAMVLSMYLVHTRLGDELRAELPQTAPTTFMVDIQPDQWDALKSQLEQLGATGIDSVPIVNARLSSRTSKREWANSREQNLTYLATLPAGNQVVAGSLWSDPHRAELSIEQEFADDLGVGLGDTLAFTIQGVPIELTVTSLRTVDWKTFGINFFLVAEPGTLDDAPQRRVAAMRLPEGRDGAVQDAIVRQFPNVTVISIRDILTKVVRIFDRVGLGIRLLGSFTVLAGIVILAGAIATNAARRSREIALLKAVGMTRAQLLGAQAIEFALAGLAAGSIGATTAAFLSYGIVTQVMEIGGELRWVAIPLALAVVIVLAIGAGSAASLRALRLKPIVILRES